jgi:hypothetical protein
MTHPSCPNDWGLILMWLCLGFAPGLLLGKLVSDAEHRKPPQG